MPYAYKETLYGPNADWSASASSVYITSYPAYEAIDGNRSSLYSRWMSASGTFANGGNATGDTWWQVEFASPLVLVGLVLHHSFAGVRDATAFGSSTGDFAGEEIEIGAWTDVAVGDLGSTITESPPLDFALPGEYKAIRLSITRVSKDSSWVILNEVGLRIGQLADVLAGIAVTADGAPVDAVVLREWSTRAHYATATPGPGGEWEVIAPFGMYDITYFADGYAPQCHGPYTVS